VVDSDFDFLDLLPQAQLALADLPLAGRVRELEKAGPQRVEGLGDETRASCRPGPW